MWSLARRRHPGWMASPGGTGSCVCGRKLSRMCLLGKNDLWVCSSGAGEHFSLSRRFGVVCGDKRRAGKGADAKRGNPGVHVFQHYRKRGSKCPLTTEEPSRILYLTNLSND